MRDRGVARGVQAREGEKEAVGNTGNNISKLQEQISKLSKCIHLQVSCRTSPGGAPSMNEDASSTVDAIGVR